MKKTLCLFLVLAMLLGMTAGCGGKKDPTAAPTTGPAVTEAPATEAPATEAPATQVPTEAPTTEAPPTEVPTEAPATEAPATEVPPTESPATEPPTEVPTEAPPEGSALYAYRNALLPSSYRLTLHWEMSRSMGKELLITTDDRVLTVLNADDPASMTASEQWDRHIEGNAIDQKETYQFWFARGNTVLEQDRRYYRAAQNAKDFLAVRPPLAMLTPENYGSVEWADESRSAIRFSEAEDTEWEWLGLNCTGITEAAGTVELDARGQIARTIYDAVFSLEGIDVAVHVSADLEDWSGPVEIPKISSDRAVPVGSVEAIPLLDLASCGFLTDGFTGNYVAFVQSLAAGSVLLQQGWYGIGEDQAGPMLLEKVSKTTYSLTTKSTDVEYRHYGGKTVYQIDGSDQEPAASPEAIEEGILDFLYDFWPDLTYLENLSLSEEEDCWLIQAELNRDGMKWFHGNTEFLMFSDRGYMDDLGVSFRPGTGTLWLSVDKGSGFPIHSLIEFEGDHRYQGQTLEVSAQLEWNYLPADPDAHYVITEKWEDQGAPEVPPTPLFYKVTAPDGSSLWLLGTIHIGDLRTSYLPQELYDALLSSDALAVEIDVTNMEERLEEDDDLMEAYQASILYPDGSSAFDHLNEEQGEKLKNALHLYGGDMMASLLSYNVATLTSLLEQETLPLGRLHSYEHGVDNQLVNMAKENGIPVRDVEDFVEHISLLSGFSEELQALMLEETIDGGRYGSNMGAAELFDVWCRGDEEEIARSFEEEEEDEELTEEEQALVEEYNRGMMTLRNAKMVEKAQEYLASEDTVFFAVGLAHLVGEDGIVNSLRDLGYTVETVRYGE